MEFPDVTTTQAVYPTAEAGDNQRGALCDFKMEYDCAGKDGTTYDRLRLIWELEQTDPDTGKHFIVSRPWSNTFGRVGAKTKNAMLTMVESWEGRSLTDEEKDSWSWRDKIGKAARLDIIHAPREAGGVHVNIGTVREPKEGQEYKLSGEYVRPVPTETPF